MKAVRLHSRAAAEIETGREYYNEAQDGLGDEFAAAVEAGVGLIGKQPKAFSPYRKGYRKFLVDGFPYLIFYAEFDEFVWVAAVHHSSREPDTWMDRTPDDNP